jgi:hypothetical protein
MGQCAVDGVSDGSEDAAAREAGGEVPAEDGEGDARGRVDEEDLAAGAGRRGALAADGVSVVKAAAAPKRDAAAAAGGSGAAANEGTKADARPDADATLAEAQRPDANAAAATAEDAVAADDAIDEDASTGAEAAQAGDDTSTPEDEEAPPADADDAPAGEDADGSRGLPYGRLRGGLGDRAHLGRAPCRRDPADGAVRDPGRRGSAGRPAVPA